MRFDFGKATISSCVPLVLKLHDNVWGWSCVLKTCGIVHGRSVFVVPHLFQGELQVEESFSSAQRDRGKSFFPACCYSGLLIWFLFFFFFSLFNSQGGDLFMKVHSIFFQTNRFCMSYVQLWQYEKPHLFKRHWYIKHIY